LAGFVAVPMIVPADMVTDGSTAAGAANAWGMVVDKRKRITSVLKDCAIVSF